MEGIITYAQSFFVWLLQTTLTASLVICLILLIQKMLGNKLGPRWCHALWLVLLIRMVLPWSPSSRVSLSNLITSWDRQIQHWQKLEPAEQRRASPAEQTTGTPEAITSKESKSESSTQEQATPGPRKLVKREARSGPRLVSLRRILPIFWLAGSIVIGTYLLVSNFALWRIVKRDRPLVEQPILELFEECKARMGVQSLVVVVPSDQVKSPGLFGFIRPRLLLPQEMLDTATQEEMRYVFLHELAHLKRRDIYLGWLTSLLQVLHWFNPLVWYAFYRIRADRELACDALVLARTQKGESQEYGQAIVSLVRRFSRSRSLPAMAGILESKSQLKRRITMITQFKNNSYHWSPLAVILIIMLGFVSLPDAKRTKASGISSAKPPRMVVRRVWANAGDPRFTGAPSPDGKYISFVNWKTGDLAIHELASGNNRNLTNEGWEKGFALNSVFSPDSKQVAYYWWNEEKDLGQLRIVGLDGSEPRVINRDNENAEFPTGWTPDGKYILTLGGNEDKSLQIFLVPVEGGPVRVLKTLRKRLQGGPWRAPGFCLSPDGRYVAYTFLAGEDSTNGDISVLSVDGSRDIPLVKHPADDFMLGWAPDGKRVVFASDRTGNMGIWTLKVADGKPQGTPHLLKPEIGKFHPMGLTPNGSYYYGIASMGNNVYVAEYDPQKGKITGKPVLTVKHYEGSNMAPDWSPDGRYLACLSMRPEGRIFLIYSVETGQVRELSPNLKAFKVNLLRWSTDGRSLLGAVKGRDGGLLKIDVETGEVTIIVEGRGLLYPKLSADGKAVFYVSRVGGEGWRILRRDLTTGEEKELFRAAVARPGVTVGGILGLALSPDGKQLAFQDLDAGMLKVLPVAGGQPRELVKFKGKATIAWAPDGSHLLYANWLGTIRPGGLWRISADGGEPQRLDLKMRYVNHVGFHPDGRRITFTSRAEGKIEVWVMENFLPKDIGK